MQADIRYNIYIFQEPTPH